MATLIYLHGAASTPREYLRVSARAAQAGVHCVLPAGPHRTADGNFWWEEERGTAGAVLQPAVSLIGEVLGGVETLEAGPIVLGGFSQGAAAALVCATQYSTRIAGVVLHSGFLADASDLSYEVAALSSMPVLVTAGVNDEVVPDFFFQGLVEMLQRARVDLQTIQTGGGHEVSDGTLTAAMEFINALPTMPRGHE